MTDTIILSSQAGAMCKDCCKMASVVCGHSQPYVWKSIDVVMTLYTSKNDGQYFLFDLFIILSTCRGCTGHEGRLHIYSFRAGIYLIFTVFLISNTGVFAFYCTP